MEPLIKHGDNFKSRKYFAACHVILVAICWLDRRTFILGFLRRTRCDLRRGKSGGRAIDRGANEKRSLNRRLRRLSRTRLHATCLANETNRRTSCGCSGAVKADPMSAECRAQNVPSACGSSAELWGDSGSYELCGIARWRFRLSTYMPPVVAASQEALMSIKRILVPLPGSASHTGEIELALSAAKALGAHVQALFITQPPPVTRGGVSVSELGRTATVASVNSHAEERERTARDAREVFAQACAAVGIPMLSADDEPGSPLAASWREAEGSYVEIAVQRAAAFDLVVAASGSVMESLMPIAEQSLLQTRRPVLLAPARLQSDLTDGVMIAWDESPECWHAVSAAIPFMHLAKSVRVISVERDASNRQASQAEVLAYLRCHGI